LEACMRQKSNRLVKRAEGLLIRAGRLYPHRYMFAVPSRRDKRQ
jgi:hypothetical protein